MLSMCIDIKGGYSLSNCSAVLRRRSCQLYIKFHFVPEFELFLITNVGIDVYLLLKTTTIS